MALIDPLYLGALQPKPSHQALLIESEGVDAAVQCVCGKAAGHPFVHDHYARAGADLLTAGLVNPIDRSLVHQEESVTILLNAGL